MEAGRQVLDVYGQILIKDPQESYRRSPELRSTRRRALGGGMSIAWIPSGFGVVNANRREEGCEKPKKDARNLNRGSDVGALTRRYGDARVTWRYQRRLDAFSLLSSEIE